MRTSIKKRNFHRNKKIMTLFEKLLEHTGTSKVPLWARESYGFRGRVVMSGEFKRISALPRRQWRKKPKLIHIINATTQMLKTKNGTMSLWPIQAQALYEISKYQGGFLPIGVGQGKSLISLLASVVLGAKKPILFVPAALRDQTLKYVIPEMSEHWQLPKNLKVIGYSELSLAKNATILEDIQPDLIVIDECHHCKNQKTGRTRRLVRYFRAHPSTKCVAMSGTISNRSLKDWAHISNWCLGALSPVPRIWQQLADWADALDEKISDEQRIHPGALMQFCTNGETAREGFQRRLVETPGIVASKASELGTSLKIQKLNINIPQKIQDMITKAKITWETPNGDIITEAVELWRHVRELSMGFWYRWDPPAPREWLEARKAWKLYVRETLKHNRRGLDTELQVWNACENTTNQFLKEWINWKKIKNTFKPHSVAQWESDFIIKFSKKWLNSTKWEIGKKGICWVEHKAVGEKLNFIHPYFGAGDNSIINCLEKGIIASISAHGTGKNLQRFSRNLIVCPPTSGQVWEQLLGRTHRPGQEADVVEVDVLLHTEDLVKAFEQAQADARYLESTYGNRQKLNYGDIII
jgi:hypothetical protein